MTELELAGRWLLVVLALGWLGAPLARRLLPGLPDGAVCLARPLAILLAGYAAWLTAALRLLPFPAAIWFVGVPLLALLAGLSLVLGRRDALAAAPSRSSAGRAWGFWLAHELVFVAAFAGFAWLRGYTPDIVATEKPMELMLLNSALHAGAMPPSDGWLAGYSVNYYYLGYVLAAVLTHLSNAPVGYAFNLMLTTIVALCAATAFGLAAGLWALHRDEARPRLDPAAGGVGLLAAYLLVAAGNLVASWSWLGDPAGTVAASWWGGIGWRSSRILVDQLPGGRSWEAITEFPWFSFILGDLHPHVLALPFGLLALGVALDWWRWSPAPDLLKRDRLAVARLATGALATGALYAINSWDFPLYLLLTGLALTRPAWWAWWMREQGSGGAGEQGGHPHPDPLPQGGRGDRSEGGSGDEPWPAGAASAGDAPAPAPSPARRERAGGEGGSPAPPPPGRADSAQGETTPWAGDEGGSPAPLSPRAAALAAAALLGLSVLLLLPFYLSFTSFAGNSNIRLAPPLDRLPLLSSLARTVGIVTWPRTDLGEFLLIWGCLATAAAAWLALLARRGLGLAPNLVGLALVGLGLAGVLLGSAPLALGGGLVLLALLVWRFGRVSAAESFACLLIAVGFGLPVVAEFVFLQDVFANRMNTIFKAYFQAWALLSLAGALGAGATVAALAGLRRPGTGGRERALTLAGGGLLAGTLLLTLGYPLIATPARAEGFARRPGLDGLGYVANHPDEQAALAWLAANVPPGTVVAEDPGHSYGEHYGLPHGRAATITGTLAPVVWPGHEMQWRANQPQALAEVNARVRDIQELYGTTDPAVAQRILARYGIAYVYVGLWERAAENRQRARQPVYSPAALAKFDQFMEVAFRQGQVTIYRRRA
jgi:uncharacterized membrane protein